MDILKNIRQWFDVRTSYGWLLPLFLPLLLWWLSTQKALNDTGLISEIYDRTAAIAKVTNYVKDVSDVSSFPGKPVISVHNKRNGNKEARLVVRTMNDMDVIDDVLTPFIFPALTSILFGLWCIAIAWKFGKPPRKSFMDHINVMLIWVNIGAMSWFFGLSRILEVFTKFVK